MSSISLQTRRLPEELDSTGREINLREIIDLPNDTDKFTFQYGDHVKNARAFNEYLEVNVAPGSNVSMMKSQVLKLITKMSMQLNTGGLDSLPMVCQGNNCMRIANCNLKASGLGLPVGEACPVERAEINIQLKNLARDFEDLPSTSDKIMVQGVVACEILKARVFSDMATRPDILVMSGKGFDKKGNKIEELVDNPNFRVWNNVHKVQQALLKSLYMTLEQRKDMTKSKSTDTLRELYRKRLIDLKTQHGAKFDIKDAELKPVEQLVKSDQDQYNTTGGSNVEVHNRPEEGSQRGSAPVQAANDDDLEWLLGSSSDGGTGGDARNSTEGNRPVGRTEKRIAEINSIRERLRKQDPGESAEQGRSTREENPQPRPHDSGMEVVD